MRRPASLETDYYGEPARSLRPLGYIEGKNLLFEYRFADGKVERLADLAKELVELKLDVIVVTGTQAALALKKATTTVPIVMANVNDPLGSGIINSLARPEGNITGLANIIPDLSAKFLELLRTVAPKVGRVGVLVNPSNSGAVSTLSNIRLAAQNVGVLVVLEEARTPKEIEDAFSRMVKERAGAVIVIDDAIFIQQRGQIAELAIKSKLPSVFGIREFTDAGGLMSYGVNYVDMYRRSVNYVDKIIKGAKPADLPVEQPTTFEYVINLKTAKALGLTIPQELLLRADDVIR